MRVFDVVKEKEVWTVATRRKIKVLSLISSSLSESAAFERWRHLKENDAEGAYHIIPWNDIEEKARMLLTMNFALARRLSK